MQKGFTMVELLVVIVIVALLVVLVVPMITAVIDNSRSRLLVIQIQNIEEATATWAVDNTEELPTENGHSITITLGDLKDGGYLEDEVINPTNNQPFPNDLIIEIEMIRNSYRYNVLIE